MKKQLSFHTQCLLLFCLLSSTRLTVVAQEVIAKRTWDVAVIAGTTIAYTDISANRFGRDESWAAGITGSKYLSRRFALRGGLLTGEIVGKGSKEGVNTKYSFKARINAELSLQGLIQFGDLFCCKGSARIAPYAFLGIGVINMNPSVYQKGIDGSANYFIDKVKGTKDNTVDYRNLTHFIVPAGIGFKFRLSDRYSLGLEGGCRISTSDKLNGYNENPATFDAFAFYAVGLTIHLGKQGEVLQWTGCTENHGKTIRKHSFDKVSRYGKKTAMKQPQSAGLEKIIPEQIASDVPSQAVNREVIVNPDTFELQEKSSPHSADKPWDFTSVPDRLPFILFSKGGYLIEGDALSALDTIARVMQGNPEAKLKISGYVNRSTSSQQEKSLALIRAEAVKNRLVRAYGISASRLETAAVEVDPNAQTDEYLLRKVDVSLVR